MTDATTLHTHAGGKLPAPKYTADVIVFKRAHVQKVASLQHEAVNASGFSRFVAFAGTVDQFENRGI